ncbi:MAG TPA: hypothetical protein VKM35_00475 [Arenimonas sp.]|nr:hypothetical protein [Arenimonas sp.]HMB55665.1 hypothetical protein [Arenimonas sp.]
MRSTITPAPIRPSPRRKSIGRRHPGDSRKLAHRSDVIGQS